MSLFRTLLWWLLLAAFGALAWELLSLDLGEVVIRWHGTTVTTTVAFFLVAWLGLWLLAWLLWTLLRLPFTAWQSMAQTQARNRLVNGLAALHEGRHARAGGLLDKAAEDRESASVARLAARQAALRRGDLAAAASQQAELARTDPLAAALDNAESLLRQGKPQAALDLLQSAAAEKRPLPPSGLLLQGEALVAAGRANDALAIPAELAREPNYASERIAALEGAWQAAAVRQAGHANELHVRWQQVPERWRNDPALVMAFATRAGQLGLESEAANALADTIDRRWDEGLVQAFSALPAAREDLRLARAQAWLPAHPDSPALALCLGRLNRRAQQLGRAEESLHRAIAQGAGADAWEELGHVYTALGDAARAQASYANALRGVRGEAPRPIGGRSLREQIADEAVAEQRNEHGLPHLPR